jgi:hypothetical protein
MKKMVIQLSPEQHRSLLKYASEASPAYSTLKNGLITGHSDGVQSRIVIVCDEYSVKMLRQNAKHFCPQAGLQIENWMPLAMKNTGSRPS